jgi:hypothetical protein
LGTTRLIYAAALLVSVDGSFGVHGVAYPLYYDFLSPFRGLRSPARFSALVGLTLVILAGFGARRAFAWRHSRAYQHAAFAAMIVFVMIDAWPSLTLTPVWTEPPPIYDALRFAPKAVLVELPLSDDPISNVPYMYFSMWHWARMVNGYSGFIPDSYAEFQKQMLLFPTDWGMDALRKRGVTYVSVNCGLGYPDCDQMRAQMRRRKDLRLTSSGEWNGHPVELYEVVAP